jgi:hypothetical protein
MYNCTVHIHYTLQKYILVRVCIAYLPEGADSPPLPLHVATAGKNHLNKEITPLLHTGIGEQYCQTISNLGHAALSDIRHTPGQENMIADALSHPSPLLLSSTSSTGPVQRTSDPPLTSLTTIAENWPEEGLAAPQATGVQEKPTIHSLSSSSTSPHIARSFCPATPCFGCRRQCAQPVDFSAIAQIQQSCL